MTDDLWAIEREVLLRELAAVRQHRDLLLHSARNEQSDPAETDVLWGVRYYGRGPFVVPYSERAEAEMEMETSDDKHRPAVLVRCYAMWTEVGPRKEPV